jgi:hypothetical protein
VTRLVVTIEAGTTAKQAAALLAACPPLAVIRGNEDGSVSVETRGRPGRDEPEEVEEP